MNPINKWVLIVGAVLLGTLAITKTAPALDAADLSSAYQDAAYPSVQLRDRCSGTIIEAVRNLDSSQSFKVLTAAHCTDKTIGEIMRIDLPVYVNNQPFGEVKFAGILVAYDKDIDLALYEVRNVFVSFDVPQAVVASEADIPALKFGASVLSVSYGQGWAQSMVEGLLGRLEVPDWIGTQTVFYQRASTPTIAGSSGSGLFIKIDGKYKLIGTLTGGTGETFNFYSRLTSIIKFLEDYKKPVAPPTASTPKEFKPFNLEETDIDIKKGN